MELAKNFINRYNGAELDGTILEAHMIEWFKKMNFFNNILKFDLILCLKIQYKR